MTIAMLGFAGILVGTVSVYASEKVMSHHAPKFELTGGILLFLGFAMIGSSLEIALT